MTSSIVTSKEKTFVESERVKISVCRGFSSFLLLLIPFILIPSESLTLLMISDFFKRKLTFNYNEKTFLLKQFIVSGTEDLPTSHNKMAY